MLPVVRWNDALREKHSQVKQEQKEYLKRANISHSNRAERLEEFLKSMYPEILKEFNEEETKYV